MTIKENNLTKPKTPLDELEELISDHHKLDIPDIEDALNELVSWEDLSNEKAQELLKWCVKARVIKYRKKE